MGWNKFTLYNVMDKWLCVNNRLVEMSGLCINFSVEVGRNDEYSLEKLDDLCYNMYEQLIVEEYRL